MDYDVYLLFLWVPWPNDNMHIFSHHNYYKIMHIKQIKSICNAYKLALHWSVIEVDLLQKQHLCSLVSTIQSLMQISPLLISKCTESTFISSLIFVHATQHLDKRLDHRCQQMHCGNGRRWWNFYQHQCQIASIVPRLPNGRHGLKSMLCDSGVAKVLKAMGQHINIKAQFGAITITW